MIRLLLAAALGSLANGCLVESCEGASPDAVLLKVVDHRGVPDCSVKVTSWYRGEATEVLANKYQEGCPRNVPSDGPGEYRLVAERDGEVLAEVSVQVKLGDCDVVDTRGAHMVLPPPD